MTDTARWVPGTLVLVVGPSGSGKDTLIRGARERLGAGGRYHFARRVITRSKDGHEDHEAVTRTEFQACEERGGFALSWSAHGCQYGISRTIDAAIDAGATVICNVSRTVVGSARARYRRVFVIEVTAPPAILAERLAQRGRDAPADQAGRLKRQAPAAIEPDVLIANTGTIDEGVALLVAAITGPSGSRG